MIVSNFSSPNRSLLFIGSNVIQILNSYQFESINPKILFRKYNEDFPNISFSYLMFALDWLFIAGVVSLDESGDILKCN